MTVPFTLQYYVDMLCFAMLYHLLSLSRFQDVVKSPAAAITDALATQSAASVPQSLSSAVQFTVTALSSLSAATRFAVTTSSASVASFQSVSSNHAAPSYPSERGQHPKVHSQRDLQLCFH